MEIELTWQELCDYIFTLGERRGAEYQRARDYRKQIEELQAHVAMLQEEIARLTISES